MRKIPPLSFTLMAGDMVRIVSGQMQQFIHIAPLLQHMRCDIVPVLPEILDAKQRVKVRSELVVTIDWRFKTEPIRFGPTSMAHAVHQRERLLAPLHREKPKAPTGWSNWGWERLAIVILALVVPLGAYVHSAGQRAAALHAVQAQESQNLNSAAATGISPVPRAYSTPDIKAQGYLETAGLKNLKVLAGKIGIALRPAAQTSPGAQAFYVFSRPGCAACTNVEAILPKVDSAYAPMIIPSGFQNDSTGGQARAVSQAYCAKDPGEAWLAQSGKEQMPAAFGGCDWVNASHLALLTGLVSGAVEPNSPLPVIVAPNGAVHQGDFMAKDPAKALSVWLAANRDPSAAPAASDPAAASFSPTGKEKP